MSLTRHLSDRSSPVARWFKRHFPDTAWLVKEENRRIRGGVGPAAPLVSPVDGSDLALVGTTTEQVLAAWLGGARPVSGAIRRGCVSVDGVLSMSGGRPGAAHAVARVALERLAELNDDDAAAARDWDALSRAAVVVGRIEQAARSRATVNPVVAYLRRSEDVDELGRLMAAPPTLEDLKRVATETLALCDDLRLAATKVHGPTFACSALLGGADADLLVDGVLLDLKTSASDRPLSREYLWQLLGYLLADTHDDHGINDVGFIWPRWRFRSQWRADDFVAILGGGEASLAELRQSFRELCEALRPRPRS